MTTFVKEFYDPHPCPYGAMYSLPVTIKEEIDKINGQRLHVQEVIDRIYAAGKKVLPAIKFSVYFDPIQGYVLVNIQYNDRYDAAHTFCVLKFRD